MAIKGEGAGLGGIGWDYVGWIQITKGAGNSEPKKIERAGPSYARFLVFLEAWILSDWYAC